jgi:hypothetical protein
MAGSTIKQYRKTRKAPGAFKKTKGNYYNYDKPGYFTKNYKIRTAKVV